MRIDSLNNRAWPSQMSKEIETLPFFKAPGVLKQEGKGEKEKCQNSIEINYSAF